MGRNGILVTWGGIPCKHQMLFHGDDSKCSQEAADCVQIGLPPLVGTLVCVHYLMQKYDNSISLLLLPVREPICQTHYDLSSRVLEETKRSEECDENKYHRHKLVGFSLVKYNIVALKMN